MVFRHTPSWAIEQKDANLFAKAHEDFERLKVLAIKQDSVRIRQWQADTCLMLFRVYRKAEMLDEAVSMYEELKTLANMYGNEDRMLERQAEAGMALAETYSEAGNIQESKALLDEVEPVVKKLPDGLERLKRIAKLRQKLGMK